MTNFIRIVAKKIRAKIRKKSEQIISGFRDKNPGFKKLESEYRMRNPLLLHFGCGTRILKGWVNIDIFFKPYELSAQTDCFQLNIVETGLPIPDNSVDAIFHEDFAEHLDQKEQIVFLTETLRVLKPGSIHRVNTPNLLNSMREHSDFKKGGAGVYVDEWNKWDHKTVLTPEYLKEIAIMVGYRDVVFTGRNGSGAKEIPPEYRPGSDRPENGNIFADLIK